MESHYAILRSIDKCDLRGPLDHRQRVADPVAGRHLHRWIAFEQFVEQLHPAVHVEQANSRLLATPHPYSAISRISPRCHVNRIRSTLVAFVSPIIPLIPAKKGCHTDMRNAGNDSTCKYDMHPFAFPVDRPPFWGMVNGVEIFPAFVLRR